MGQGGRCVKWRSIAAFMMPRGWLGCRWRLRCMRCRMWEGVLPMSQVVVVVLLLLLLLLKQRTG